MGLFGKSQQQQFDELCANTLAFLLKADIDQPTKDRLCVQFLSAAKAAADDKTCDVMGITERAANDVIIVARTIDSARRSRRS